MGCFFGGDFFAGGAGFASLAFSAGTGLNGSAGAAASLPFFFPFSSLVAALIATPTFAAGAGAAFTSAFFPRFTGGGGGGGGGGGSKGFRNLMVSVRERSLPSSSRRKTSSASLGYTGRSGVMRSSVISGSGIRCFIWRHLPKKFLILFAAVWFRVVVSRKRIVSGLLAESSFHARDGVAASLPDNL